MQFDQFNLDNRLVKAIDHLGFEKASDIQQQAIPAAMAGNDLIASSKTGSGKTLAFLLPALHRLIRQRALAKRDPRVVILTPTRELAKQVFSQLRLVSSGTQFKSVLILGGENFNDQVKVLSREPHIIVATPGRLADHLDQGHFYLHGLELLILDEADRMLDLGFADQLKRIHQAADHRKRQTLMFSATMDHQQVEDFALDLLNKPKRIAVGEITSEHKDIHQRFVLSDHLDHKEALLNHLLANESFQQMIIFTATRADTERLAVFLQEQGIESLALSGDLKQADRNRIMEQFAKGQAKVLVTTDLASRGLDLVNVSHVINFDLPKHPEEYVHRIGRTGRAGEKGDAISFIGPKDWQSYLNIQAFLQQTIEFSVIEGFEAKFKGVKPKPKRKPDQKGHDAKPVQKKAAKPKAKPKKRIFHEAEDIGDMPVMRRKPGEYTEDSE
ncbi:DEAD/DEAH box helicase [Thalassotalea sp. PS06]|uniref:DEAD/DEAH box helicase n=1 Tax=Thalassotalea sp. PS06 TaxID=2594005 RepID=UPI0011637D09|nr:DEAD/DEAH box helicase [Thalassotalea sp. PS06]QDP01588.1 DEAD/DEAH box helicase [Thalassotalea sp. PS06]